MKKYILFAFIILSQSLSAAVITVANGSNEEFDVIIKYGVNNQKEEKPSISSGKSVKINSGIHEFYSIQWGVKGSGKFYDVLYIPSPRLMLDGKLIIHNGGWFLINFNTNGTYTGPLKWEKGQSSRYRRTMEPNY